METCEIESNRQYTFSELISKCGIKMPMVQRAYVQGRKSAAEIREHFVGSLLSAVTKKQDPLMLYFVYGKIDERACFIPLDGQQRLTTLFLLHWYFRALPQGVKGFAYEARRMAQEFVAWLISVAFEVRSNESPREWMLKRNDFIPAWESDDSVAGMIATLETIHTLCVQRHIENVSADDLDRISFRIHLVGDNVNAGESYLKINARGAVLTPWENIKSIMDAGARKTIDGHTWLANINGDWLGFIEQYLPEIPNEPEANLEDYIDEACSKLNAAFRNLVDLAFSLDSVGQTDNVDSFHRHIASYQLYRDCISSRVLRIASELFSLLGDRDLCEKSWSLNRSDNCLWNPASAQSIEKEFCSFVFDASEDQRVFTYFRALRFALIAHYRAIRKAETEQRDFIAITRVLNVLDALTEDIGRENICKKYVELSNVIDDLAAFANGQDEREENLEVIDVERKKAGLFFEGKDLSFVEIEKDPRFGDFRGFIEFSFDSECGRYQVSKADFFERQFLSIEGSVQRHHRFCALMSYIGKFQGAIYLPLENKPSEWTKFFLSPSVKDAYDELYKCCGEMIEAKKSVLHWVDLYNRMTQISDRKILRIDKYPLEGENRLFAFVSPTMKGRPNYNILIDLNKVAQRFVSHSIKNCAGNSRFYLRWHECFSYLELTNGEGLYVKLHDILDLMDESKEIACYKNVDDKYEKIGIVNV